MSNQPPNDTNISPSVSAPNGIAIGRDNYGNPVVNNYGPPPLALKWSQQEVPSDKKELPFRVMVQITPNVEWHPVSMAIICDHAIREVHPVGLFSYLEAGPTVESDAVAFVSYKDPGLAANSAQTVYIFSDQPFKVLDVKIAIKK